MKKMSDKEGFKNGLEVYENNKNPYESYHEEKEKEEQEEPKKDLLEQYFDECDVRIARVKERYDDSRLQEILIKKIVRPFHYFEGGQNEEPITDRQKEYLMTLAEEHKRKFFGWCAQEEGVPEVGEIDDRIRKMSKTTASNAISELKGGE